MLSVLKIKNIAVIESAEIEFSRGFQVLTGETGAGKSIVLDAIGAVLGFRTSRELIRTGEEQAEVSALFFDIGPFAEEKLSALSLPPCEDGALLITRAISADRGICRVNGELTTASVLRELGETLIDIHGQQDSRALLDTKAHLHYIDSLANDAALLSDYKEKYGALRACEKEIRLLSADDAEKTHRADLLNFQIDELQKAAICVGEWDELKEKRERIRNAEKIKKSFREAYEALFGGEDNDGAVALTKLASSSLRDASLYSAEASSVQLQLDELYYLLDDLASRVRDGLMDAESEEDAEAIEERLDLLYSLSLKYGDTEEKMLAFSESAQDELSSIEHADERLAALEQNHGKLLSACRSSAEVLSAARRKAAERFSTDVCGELRFLDMPNVNFSAGLVQKEFSSDGIDEAGFLISANVGEQPKPLAKIASGGELSRIMLAIKSVLSGSDPVGTMIFDEIDTGVSGRAASKVAQKLRALSKGRQVICVTHLAQLASLADDHFLIEKATDGKKTYTAVKALDRGGRISELARIIGGEHVTQTQLQSAAEMLDSAGE